MKPDGGPHWLRAKISASLQAWGERAEAAAYVDRDAEWRAALELSHYDAIDGLHLDCEQCAPLRTLVGNAAPKETPSSTSNHSQEGRE